VRPRGSGSPVGVGLFSMKIQNKRRITSINCQLNVKESAHMQGKQQQDKKDEGSNQKQERSL